MRTKTQSFLKRLTLGGTLAAGVGLLFATGCALDEDYDEDDEGLVGEDAVYGEGSESITAGDGIHTPTHAAADGELIAICHFGPLGSPDDSEDLLVSESELPAHLGHGDVFGTCAEFFCSGS